MFERILIPLDGSSRAERALPVAARIARTEGGCLTLYRALPPSLTSSPLYGHVSVGEWLLEEELAVARAYLMDLTQSDALADLPMSCEVGVGDPAQVILQYAEAHHVDLIVLCSHGRSTLGRWILGSVADHLTRHAPMPILVLREQGSIPPESADLEHLFRVLVPLDGSELAEEALLPAIHLASALAAPQPAGLHLTMAVEPADVMARPQLPEAHIIDNARRYLLRLTERVQAEHPEVTTTWTVRVDADVASGILLVAEGGEDAEGASPFGGCDVIALTTHGRTGFARWALGSVAERMLHTPQFPILIVRPSEVQARRHA
jgi:nucleotide-binding universal stress UspA family protein